MNSSPDPFALSFDSIHIEPKRRDGDSMTDLGTNFGAHTAAAPLARETPGFYLLDDANGRFTIERDTGIVTLAHEHLLSIESGAVHPVRIRVVEMSGASYELNMRMRMTGRVPQIAGAEENDGLAGLAASPLLDLMTPEEKSVHEVVVPEPPALPWVKFSAFAMIAGKQALYGETAPFGALFQIPATLPDVYLDGSELALPAPLPEPSAAIAAWAL